MLIVLHHLSQRIDVVGPMKIMGYIGIITVALFFFLSGYGLRFGFEHKDNYLEGFLKRKIVPILIPYALVNVCCLFYRLIFDQEISCFQSIISFLGWEYLTGLWFVTAILIFYLIFWISFQCCNKHANQCLLCLTIIYIFMATYVGLHSCWTSSIIAFYMGVIWEDCRKKFELWVRAKYWIKLAITTVCFFGMFFGRLYISSKGYNDQVPQIILRNIVCILFVLWVIAIFQKTTFKSAVWGKIGSYSLEIYMTHYVLVGWLTSISDKSLIYIFSVIILTIVSSLIIKKLTSLIITMTLKNC